MRVHLANRHKASTALAREIMNDMKPDIDVSLNRIPRQESSDGKFAVTCWSGEGFSEHCACVFVCVFAFVTVCV